MNTTLTSTMYSLTNSHAFDSILRESILTSLYSNKIPHKLINLIKLTLENTTVKVKVNNNYISDFRVDIGVKQGDPLSPTLFNLVIDTVLTQLDLRGNISTSEFDIRVTVHHIYK